MAGRRVFYVVFAWALVSSVLLVNILLHQHHQDTDSPHNAHPHLPGASLFNRDTWRHPQVGGGEAADDVQARPEAPNNQRRDSAKDPESEARNQRQFPHRDHAAPHIQLPKSDHADNGVEPRPPQHQHQHQESPKQQQEEEEVEHQLQQQGPNSNNGQCQPQRRILYIKTHKTGSSTLANMFHRIADKYNLRPALPTDNTYYAWPSTSDGMVLHSIDRKVRIDQPYEILCSAHVTRAPGALNQLVPDAKYVTILRDPATHFVSSWKYWHVYEHIKSRGGPLLQPDEFLKDRAKYKKWMSPWDIILTENSFMNDLNCPKDHNDDWDPHACISILERDFPVVMITEYFDESLLLLKRKMCWDLEDVVYFRLKMSKKPTKRLTDADRAMRKAILDMNWADKILYDHFNDTLWRQISQEKNFDQELEQLRERINLLSDQCASLQHQSDDARRAVIEDQADTTNKNDLHCHRLMLDSIGYSKHFKRRYGGYLLDELECFPMRFVRSFVHFYSNFPEDDFIQRALLNIAAEADSHVALPKGPRKPHFEPYPYPTDFIGPQSPKLNIISLPGLKHNKDLIASIVQPQFFFVQVFRDPVRTFVDVWEKHKLLDVLKAAHPSIEDMSMLYFLQHYRTLGNHISKEIQAELINPMSRNVLDLPVPEGPDQIKEARKQINRLHVPFIAEYMKVSSVLFRRMFCFRDRHLAALPWHSFPDWATRADLSSDHYNRKDVVRPHLLPGQTEDMIIAGIERLSAADDAIYRHANWTMWGRVTKQPALEEELSHFDEYVAAMDRYCSSTADQADEDLLFTAVGLVQPKSVPKAKQRLFCQLYQTKTIADAFEVFKSMQPVQWQTRSVPAWSHPIIT